MTTQPLQAQREAARFASTAATIDDLRHRTVRVTIPLLGRGDRATALQAMYAGLALQAPLTFKAPTSSPEGTLR